MYVLVGVLVQVKELYRLEKRAGDRHCPYGALKPVRREELRDREIASFGDDVADAAKLEGVVEIGDLRMAELYEFVHFCPSCSLHFVWWLGWFQDLCCELVVPVVGAGVDNAERTLADWFSHGVSGACHF